MRNTHIALGLLSGVDMATFSLPSVAMTLPNTTAIEAAQPGGLVLSVRDRDDGRGDRDDDGDDDGGRDN